MSFKHPTCGGTHEKVSDARVCEGLQQPATVQEWYTKKTSDRLAEAANPYEASAGSPDHMAFTGAAPRSTRVEQDGMYRNPDTGEIFKVQFNRATGNGRGLYAKRLVLWIEGERHAPSKAAAELWVKSRDSLEFEYVPGLIREIRPEWRMSLEEAVEFGELYGICVRCGRELTLESSIAAGMGRICANKSNWG